MRARGFYCGTIHGVKRWFFLWVFLLIVLTACDNPHHHNDNPIIESARVRGVLYHPAGASTWVVFAERGRLFTIPSSAFDPADTVLSTSDVEAVGNVEVFVDRSIDGRFVAPTSIRILRVGDFPPRNTLRLTYDIGTILSVRATNNDVYGAGSIIPVRVSRLDDLYTTTHGLPLAGTWTVQQVARLPIEGASDDIVTYTAIRTH